MTRAAQMGQPARQEVRGRRTVGTAWANGRGSDDVLTKLTGRTHYNWPPMVGGERYSIMIMDCGVKRRGRLYAFHLIHTRKGPNDER